MKDAANNVQNSSKSFPIIFNYFRWICLTSFELLLELILKLDFVQDLSLILSKFRVISLPLNWSEATIDLS